MTVNLTCMPCQGQVFATRTVLLTDRIALLVDMSHQDQTELRRYRYRTSCRCQKQSNWSNSGGRMLRFHCKAGYNCCRCGTHFDPNPQSSYTLAFWICFFPGMTGVELVCSISAEGGYHSSRVMPPEGYRVTLGQQARRLRETFCFNVMFAMNWALFGS